MLEFTSRVLVPHALDFTLVTDRAFGHGAPATRFGLLSAITMSVALAVHPRSRSAWPFIAIMLMGLCVPVLPWMSGTRLASWLGATPPPSNADPAGFQAMMQIAVRNHELLMAWAVGIACIGLIVVLRSWWMGLFLLLWSLSGLYLYAEAWRTGSRSGLPNYWRALDVEASVVQSMFWAWHIALPVAVLIWSLKARRAAWRACRESECPGCGYSLGGLPRLTDGSRTCPECGVSIAATPEPSSKVAQPSPA